MHIRLSRNQAKAQEVIKERSIEKDREAKVSIKKDIIRKKINPTNRRKRNNLFLRTKLVLIHIIIKNS